MCRGGVILFAFTTWLSRSRSICVPACQTRLLRALLITANSRRSSYIQKTVRFQPDYTALLAAHCADEAREGCRICDAACERWEIDPLLMLMSTSSYLKTWSSKRLLSSLMRLRTTSWSKRIFKHVSNLVHSPQVANAILGDGVFTHYDRSWAFCNGCVK